MSPTIVNRIQAAEMEFIYKTALNKKLLEECKFSDPDVIESLFLENIVPHGKNIVVGCVYRPPNQNIAMFSDKFSNIPHGDSVFFLCPTLMTRRKKHLPLKMTVAVFALHAVPIEREILLIFVHFAWHF